jgi:Histidine biosynthesis protein
MPSADQVPVKSMHSEMRWPECVVLIAGSTGSVQLVHVAFKINGEPLCIFVFETYRRRNAFGQFRPSTRCCAQRLVYAAGGVRDADDLAALARVGIAGALVASCLHNGKLAGAQIARLQQR